MRVLVLYASKYGCTEDCAKQLKGQLKHETDMINIKNTKKIDLQRYNWIIIGGSIYVGKIQKEVRSFCDQNLEILLTKNMGLFICCTTPEQTKDFFKNNFSDQLLKHAAVMQNFGGELRNEKMSFFDKKITAMVAKMEPKETGILFKNINQLAVTVNGGIE